MLTEEDEKWAVAMLEMTSTEGWSLWLEELEAAKANINSVEFTTDNNDLSFRKGQLDMLAEVLSLRDRAESLYAKKTV